MNEDDIEQLAGVVKERRERELEVEYETICGRSKSIIVKVIANVKNVSGYLDINIEHQNIIRQNIQKQTNNLNSFPTMPEMRETVFLIK